MKRVVLIVLMLALASAAFPLDLPAPPRGYAWQECPDVKGALLVPDGWHFRRLEAEEGKLAYFITRKPFEPPKPFDVGLTFNVVRDVPGKLGTDPSGFAQQFIGSITASYPKARTWQTALGPFVGYGAIYQGAKGDTAYQFYNLVLTNDKTGTAFLLVFEAPAADWEREWATIEPVVKRLAIDDAI